jgi:hypothetical protein
MGSTDDTDKKHGLHGIIQSIFRVIRVFKREIRDSKK